MSNVSFFSPEWFLLFLPMFGFAVLRFYRKSSRPSAGILVPELKGFRLAGTSLRVQTAWVPTALVSFSAIFLVFAMARPVESTEKVKRNVEGIDIMIALDVSDSMLIEDMRPLNRLEAAKERIAEFVKGRVSDRIGIVIFAGESFTLIPLTLDYDLILERITSIQTAQMARIKDGTAIGVALANAAGRLRESTAKSRVIIFMTDGENNSGTIDPETGLTIAKGYGLKIYSIGLGKSGPTRIPIYNKDPFGNTIKTYQPFESTVNEELLGRFASETGGRFFRASQENSLEAVFAEINKLEKTDIEENKYVETKELFHVPLTVALVLLLLGHLLQWTVWRRSP